MHVTDGGVNIALHRRQPITKDTWAKPNLWPFDQGLGTLLLHHGIIADIFLTNTLLPLNLLLCFFV